MIGFVRTMSDGAFAVYIADILVLPDNQKQGVGSQLLRGVLDHYPMKTFHHQVLIAERDAQCHGLGDAVSLPGRVSERVPDAADHADELCFYRRMGLSAVGAFGLTAFIRTRDK